MQRSYRNPRRRGGVDQVRLNLLDQHHPGRSNNVASQLFLCVAATPPQLRRGYPADLQFIHTFHDRPFSRRRSLTTSTASEQNTSILSTRRVSGQPADLSSPSAFSTCRLLRHSWT